MFGDAGALSLWVSAGHVNCVMCIFLFVQKVEKKPRNVIHVTAVRLRYAAEVYVNTKSMN